MDDFWTWYRFGVSKGWITEIQCYTHDMIDMTEYEFAEFDKHGDPCIPIMRVWGTVEVSE